ncbi:hypothetical protein CAL28_21905 [Bordetella genomosp. 11]|uniref:Uncharacterized protein n=1 Tax=Bordetella genomosp. 11 TaxID=1416808 RepID=A0A261UJ08_9BORD|nr:hypothetical protein CAL28_21905 [Bordetella genomosp. 11]
MPVSFVAAGENTYKADVVIDRFLDEDYFGQGICHWSIVGITVELHHSKVMFSPALYNDDLLAGKKVTRFFSLRSYGHAENERIDIGAMDANAFGNPYATFSISMQAERAASNASPSMGAAGFQGDWVYQQTCGWRHAAGVSLKVRDGKATGNWSDGSGRGIGEQGSLQGDIRDGKLYAHFCTDSPEQMASDVGCTNFDTTQADYFVLRGDQLDWYQPWGKKNVKYLTLHRKIAGKRTPTDNRCEGEQ